MQPIHRRFFIASAAAALILSACSLPLAAPPPPTVGPGDYSATLGVIQTHTVQTAAAQGFGATSTPPALSLPPAQTGVSPSPVVTTDTLCWRGPGPDYEVISSIKGGTAVSMLGKGIISGWYILRNPIYGDPCWIQANALALPAGFDPSTLPIFNPPFTPTPTASPTPLVSSTPSSTFTPAPSITPTP